MKSKKDYKLYLDFIGIGGDRAMIMDSFLWSSKISKTGPRFKILRFSKKTNIEMEIYVNPVCSYRMNHMHNVARLVFCMMRSNFYYVDGISKVILNYGNIQVTVLPKHDTTSIVRMLLAKIGSKKNGTKVEVNPLKEHEDFSTCHREEYDIFDKRSGGPFKDFEDWQSRDKYHFERMGKYIGMLFKDKEGYACFDIISMDSNGITIDFCASTHINEAGKYLEFFFNPFSKLYGIQKIEAEFNELFQTVTAFNYKNFVENYVRSTEINSAIWEREREEYMRSPEYWRKQAKLKKKAYRLEQVRAKINAYHNKLFFSFKDKKAESLWNQQYEACKDNMYTFGTLQFANDMARIIEYLVDGKGLKIEDVYPYARDIADEEYGMSGNTMAFAHLFLWQTWKYGNILQVLWNKEWGYDGDGLVNPAILQPAA